MKNNEIKSFKFRVNHDGGTSVFSVPATSYDSAFRKLKKSERKPVYYYNYQNIAS